MVDANTGRPIRPNDHRSLYHSDLEVYYKLGYQGVGYSDARSFPNGLQLIAGNAATATSPTSGSRVHYWCENNHQLERINYGVSIPVCNRGQILTMGIDFPQCWDGRNLTSPNGRSHMAYGTWQSGENRETRGCPSSHPVGLPHVEMFVRYYVAEANTANWRLSSDNYTNGPGGYSGHADYIFAWNETAFDLVIQNCYRTRLDCGFTLGNRTEPRHIRYSGMMPWTQSLTN